MRRRGHEVTDRRQVTRRQLSLYAPSDIAVPLEATRQLLDPVQSRLIPAHVTLCREDELVTITDSQLESRLTDSSLKPITLHFGQPEVFDGHGVLLSCARGEQEFHALREHVLGSRAIRRHSPHMTLAHPRNPRSVGNCPANVARVPQVGAITFSSIHLIEQNADEPWKIIHEFKL